MMRMKIRARLPDIQESCQIDTEMKLKHIRERSGTGDSAGGAWEHHQAFMKWRAERKEETESGKKYTELRQKESKPFLTR